MTSLSALRRSAPVAALLATAALLAACSTAGQPTAVPDPPAPAAALATRPGDGVDLDGWTLSTPTASTGGTTPDPAAVTPPFLTGKPGAALTFWAPAEGGGDPRTELVSTHGFKAGRGSHTLTASVTPLQEPAAGQGVVIGQIHGAQDQDEDLGSVPFVLLRLQDGRLTVDVMTALTGAGHDTFPLLDAVPTGHRLDFELRDPGNGRITFSATVDGETRQGSAPLPAAFRGHPLRFQAGDSLQTGTSSGSQDGGRIVFHQLTQTTS